MMRNPNPNSQGRLREVIMPRVENTVVHEVMLITQPNCKHCSELEEMLSSAGIGYTETSVMTSTGREMALKSGAKSTPVLVLRDSNGDIYHTTNNNSLKDLFKLAKEFNGKVC